MGKPKEPPAFNNPFAKVKLAASPNPVPARPAPAPKAKPTTADAEAELFLAAVGDMAPAKSLKGIVARLEPKPESAGAFTAEEAESLTQLAELVSGESTVELGDDEGHVPGFDAQVLRRLRTGAFTTSATLDLHGLTANQSEAAVAKFIAGARREGHRCVRIVTGKGLHSVTEPVLKSSLPQWLARGKSARHVLAFCPAQAADGGSGATYVLLRRPA